MNQNLSPAELFKIVGLSPDVLRDWRRRGFLHDMGRLLLPNGETTADPKHPDLAEVGRATWVYSPGDLLSFAIAKHLINLGIGIEIAIELADTIAPHVDAWLDPNGRLDLREPRWIAAWPSTEGENPSGVELDRFATCRVSSLERLEELAGPKAIMIDTKKLAASLPDGIAEVRGYR